MEVITRRIDELGRVVLPMDFRKALGLKKNAEVNLGIENKAIIITPTTATCKLCYSNKDIDEENGICKECIKRIKAL